MAALSPERRSQRLPSLRRLFSLILACIVLSACAVVVVVVDGAGYSVVANFQTKSYASSPFPPFYSDRYNASGGNRIFTDPLLWDMLLPQQGLSSYYVVLSSSPFTMDTGGTINISLTGGSSASSDSSDGIPQFSPSTYIDFTRSFLVNATAGADPPIDTLWDSQREFFFLAQPRLHCLLNAPYLSTRMAEDGVGAVCDLNTTGFNNSKLASTVINELYMMNEAVLELKIFQWDVWFRMTKRLAMTTSAMTTMSHLEAEDFLKNVLAKRSEPYNLILDPAKVCSAPALYTVGLNNLISAASAPSSDESGSSGSSNDWPTSIVIKHAGMPQRIVAVLVQCSAVPVSVSVNVVFMNPNDVSGSLETYFTAVVYFVFMSAYALIFILYLMLIISCKRRTDATSSPASKRSADAVKADAVGDDESPRSAGSSPGSTSKRSSRRGSVATQPSARGTRGVSANSRSSSSRRRHRRRESEASWRDHDDDDSVKDTAVTGGNCCRAPNLCTRIRDGIVHIYHTYTIIVMADGRMQWLVFVTMPVKCLMCIFFAASYSVLNAAALDAISTVASLPVVSLALGVAVGTILFALEVLAAFGWGLAFKSLTTSQIVVLSVGCILYFVFRVCVLSTCPVEGRLDAFTTNAYARDESPANCVAFQYVSFSISFIYHVYNTIQIFLVTRLLGHRCVKENRDVLLRGKPETSGDLVHYGSSHTRHSRQSERGSRGGADRESRRDRDRDRDDARRKRKPPRRRPARDRGDNRTWSPNSDGPSSPPPPPPAHGDGDGDDDMLHSFGSNSDEGSDRNSGKAPDRGMVRGGTPKSKGKSAGAAPAASSSRRQRSRRRGAAVSNRSASSSSFFSESSSSGASATDSRDSESASTGSSYDDEDDRWSSRGSSRDSDRNTDSSSTISSTTHSSSDDEAAARRSRRSRASRHQSQARGRAPSVAVEGGLFPADVPSARSQAARDSIESMKIFLRYHGMRYPFAFIVLWEILFLCLSFTLYDTEHFYMKVIFEEVECLYLMCFIVLFFRKEPFYC